MSHTHQVVRRSQITEKHCQKQSVVKENIPKLPKQGGWDVNPWPRTRCCQCKPHAACRGALGPGKTLLCNRVALQRDIVS